jgi:flagella synthesis protein FlgN
VSSLQALLNEEVEALRAVLATLTAERAALAERAPDALLAASSAKADAVARAARLERECREHLEASPGARPAGINQSLNELQRLARECRLRNEANGLLIRGQRRRVEASLNVLRGGRSAPDTYGRDGETHALRSARSPLASF